MLLQCLNLPAEFLKISKGTPTEENSRRIQRFLAYLSSGGTPSELRVACLCLRLTDTCLNVSATQPDEWSLAQGAVTPTLVRLGRGDVQRKVSEALGDMLRSLQQDPDLDIVRAVHGLLLTVCHTMARYCAYNEYPIALWRLCREFNPDEYQLACRRFLECGEHLLDTGYSLPLRREAEAVGGLGAAVLYLLHPARQAELQDIFVGGMRHRWKWRGSISRTSLAGYL